MEPKIPGTAGAEQTATGKPSTTKTTNTVTNQGTNRGTTQDTASLSPPGKTGQQRTGQNDSDGR